jgi:hypothetical protein
VRRRRRVPVGGRGVRGRVRVLRARQGRHRAPPPRRAAGGGRARRDCGGTGSHAPALAGARRRAHRRGVPDQLPRAPAHARVQDRRRGRREYQHNEFPTCAFLLKLLRNATESKKNFFLHTKKRKKRA